jgi:prepilin-type N-terminal cleavage/methylation domain-containing protein
LKLSVENWLKLKQHCSIKGKKKLLTQKRRGEKMLTKYRSNKGFTLIELMIVVVIIGILAALAIPRFMRSTTKAKQTEAKQLLKQIYTMQHAYRQEFNAYCLAGVAAAAGSANFARLGVDVGTTARYTYTMTTATAAAFLCTATGNLDDDGTIDTWTINQNGTLTCTIDDSVS